MKYLIILGLILSPFVISYAQIEEAKNEDVVFVPQRSISKIAEKISASTTLSIDDSIKQELLDKNTDRIVAELKTIQAILRNLK